MLPRKLNNLKPVFKTLTVHHQAIVLLAILMIMAHCLSVTAQGVNTPSIGQVQQNLRVQLDTLWVIACGCLIFFMNGGFAMLESGFCRQKNAVNILAKNLIVFALTTLAFWAFGFGLMFSEGNAIFGLNGFFLSGNDNSPATGTLYQGVFSALSWATIPLSAKFFFQLMFAGVAASIVSGAVAERIKFLSFFIFSLVFAILCYPITGHWIWGGGWLQQLGFYDFAGSTAVHSVGGWAALVGAVLLGPRIGKYQQKRSLALPGHNLGFATLGCFILWLGWFGFNAGSTMKADAYAIGHVLLTTNMSAATGGIAAMITAWLYFGKPDLSVIINGLLGGLVAITAGSRFVSVSGAGLIGVIAGVLIVFTVDLLDYYHIDDPVGAVSVHLMGGIWGTLALALFAVGPNADLYQQGPPQGLLSGGGIDGLKQLFLQLLGIASVSLFTVVMSWIIWSVIGFAVGLRVSQEAELKGLDISEHGLQAYTGFLLKSDMMQGNSRIISQIIPPKHHE